MTIKYCQYESGEMDFIAVSGIEQEECKNIIKNGLIRSLENGVHLSFEPNPSENDLLLVEGKAFNACDLCDKRMEKVTKGCYWCRFESTKFESMRKSAENYLNEKKFFINLLKEKGAKEYNVKNLVEQSDFRKEFFPSEITFDDDFIEEKKQERKNRAQRAVGTKKYRKEHCMECLYSDENLHCKMTHPSFCQTERKRTKQEAMKKAEKAIFDKEKLLKLSMLCGQTIRHNRIRYRLSHVLNEKKGSFLATRDYYPWDTTIISYEVVQNHFKDMIEEIEKVGSVKMLGREKTNELAAVLHYIQENWNTIRNIESWGKQQMFWASFNPYKQRIDISIHLSKDTYEYSYKNLKELCSTTQVIHI